VAALLAALYSSKVSRTILLSPAIDPEKEKVFWFSKFGRYTLSKSLQVATVEKLSHAKQLETLLPYWNKVRGKVIHLHGTKDRLVSYENTAFTPTHFPNAEVNIIPIEEASHFIPWTHQELISDLIMAKK
jgi:pimeloyl-ACP methyl ester carboxylesterase